MKGISTILATILIVIIVVALVSLTYTFAVGLFTTASGGATQGVQATTIRLDKSVSIVGTPTCVPAYGAAKSNTSNVSFTVRHLGSTYNITNAELSAFLGGAPGNLIGWQGNLTPGGTQTRMYYTTSPITWVSTGTTFTVSAPAADQSKTLTICS